MSNETYKITMRSGVQHVVTGELDADTDKIVVFESDEIATNFWALATEVSSVVRLTDEDSGSVVGKVAVQVSHGHGEAKCRCA